MQLESPNKDIRIQLQFTDKTYYAIDFKGQNVMWFSPLSLSLQDGSVLGAHPKVVKATTQSIDELIPTVWGIRSEVRNAYNELKLEMEGEYSLIFRAYNDGVAYRFQTQLDRTIQVIGEEVGFRFLADHALVAHVVGDFQTSYEKLYTKYKISEVVEAEFISLPLVVETPSCKLAITEADLYDYPGMYIRKLGNNNRYFLDGLFPAYPTAWEPGGLCQFNLRVTERANYLAETQGMRDFPWRVVIVAESDTDLADSDMVYKLSRPAVIETDWIKPGKVAWDWFNDWNLTGVDFETGVNNRTYEYYIDFAAEHGLEYVIMDEGWSDVFDLLLQKPTVDVPHLVQYAKKRKVGIVLWCVWHTLDRQMQAALDQFQEWGVAGVKVDFIDRDDQIAIDFYENLARETAKRQLLLNIHGCSKPTGLHRTYPNVINYE
ncbi:MAG: glycoside hydrolase family 97 catalytic domain-containing protein, partial [Saprospiraceae bacterium]|nr:glycoside hydrolase family 97 catalytic domain-containing protein [Saprospiraceae bacterium]